MWWEPWGKDKGLSHGRTIRLSHSLRPLQEGKGPNCCIKMQSKQKHWIGAPDTDGPPSQPSPWLGELSHSTLVIFTSFGFLRYLNNLKWNKSFLKSNDCLLAASVSYSYVRWNLRQISQPCVNKEVTAFCEMGLYLSWLQVLLSFFVQQKLEGLCIFLLLASAGKYKLTPAFFDSK